MSDLEGRAKPLATALITDSPGTFNQSARRDLAAWCVKTALVGGFSITDALDPRLFHDFLESQSPSPRTRVWLMYTDVTGIQHFDFRELSIVTDPDRRPAIADGYMAVIAAGRFGALIVSTRSTDPPIQPIEARFGTGLAPIWPEREAPEWPPPGGYFNLAALDTLAETLRPNSDVAANRASPLRIQLGP